MNNLSKNIVLSAAFLAIGWGTASAVPAKPGLLTMTQPDGTELRVQLRGDERHHFYLSEDGYLLTEEADGKFCYADIDATGATVSSGIAAVPVSRRSAAARDFLSRVDMERVRTVMQGRATVASDSRYARVPSRSVMQRAGSTNPERGLFPGSNFPVHGEQKGLVILVEYTDVKFNLDDPHDYFFRMLNEPGFSDNGGTGSAKDFFVENSNGQFLPDFDVYGPVTLPKNQAYYGKNDFNGDDQNPEKMAIHACDLLDSEVDFKQYDRDGDGFIDNVFIFYAGRGEASGGAANTVWPHAWNVTYGDDNPHIYDGVQLDRYACTNEWEGGRPDGVGTFVHEFSHVMGLPDLYATTYTDAFTPGPWSALDYGPYNNDGNTPPNYGAFERYALGWMEPVDMDGPMSATLYPVSNNVAGIVRTDSDNEFFLFENRQQEGWDEFIPGHGMLIWHVHYDPSTWTRNTVNNNASHQYVDIEEADGTRTEYTRAGDCFPGTAGKTSFSQLTIPSMKPWSAKVDNNISVTNIAETEDGLITFNVCGGSDVVLEVPAVKDAADVTCRSFKAQWEGADDGLYILSVYDALNDVPVQGYAGLQVKGSSWTVTGLTPETDYYYTLRAGNGLQMSEPSARVNVRTLAVTLADLAVEALPAVKLSENSFEASWLPVEGATDYLVSVYRRPLVPAPDVVCDFTGSNVPEGWMSTSRLYYSNAAFSGSEIPSLRLNDGNSLASPACDGELTAVSFWHRASKADETTKLIVSVLVNGDWVVLKEFTPDVSSSGAVTEVDNVPSDAKAVSIAFEAGETGGSVAIDDVKVSYSMPGEAEPVEGYSPLSTGNVTSCTVSGLEADETYYYVVVATDGTLKSIPSAEVAVFLSGDSNSGIGDIAASQLTVRSEAGGVTVAGAVPGSAVAVYTLSGVTVATGKADASGSLRLAIPSPGVYILKSGATAVKLLAR